MAPRRSAAVLRVFFAVFRLLQPDLTHFRVPRGFDKVRLLRATDRSRHVLGLRRVLLIIGLAALSDLATRIGLVDIVDRHVPKRTKTAPSVGAYGGAARALAGLHGGELVLRFPFGDGTELPGAYLAALAPLDGVRREPRGTFDARAKPSHVVPPLRRATLPPAADTEGREFGL